MHGTVHGVEGTTIEADVFSYCSDPVEGDADPANGLRMVTPRQINPSCISLDNRHRHPDAAAAASMIASYNAN
jgi:hypothetical protein